MEALARQTGVEYRHVTYDIGNPAVVKKWRYYETLRMDTRGVRRNVAG